VARTLQYSQIDVFTDRPLSGNAVAVFLDGRGLETSEMQALAAELNVPETSFVLPPTAEGATYMVRTFTPQAESFVAGHAYHGTAFILAEEGLIPLTEPVTTVVQETHLGAVSPVEIEVAGGKPVKVSLSPEPPVFGRVFGRPGSPVLSALALALGVNPDDLTGRNLYPQVVTTRASQLVVCVENLDYLSNLDPDYGALVRIARQLDVTGFSVFAPHARDLRAQVHMRVFGSENGGFEDPATAGSAAALGAYLANRGVIRPDADGPARFVIEQGLKLRRPSLIEVTVALDPLDEEAYRIRVCGACVTVSAGDIYLP